MTLSTHYVGVKMANNKTDHKWKHAAMDYVVIALRVLFLLRYMNAVTASASERNLFEKIIKILKSPVLTTET